MLRDIVICYFVIQVKCAAIGFARALFTAGRRFLRRSSASIARRGISGCRCRREVYCNSFFRGFCLSFILYSLFYRTLELDLYFDVFLLFRNS